MISKFAASLFLSTLSFVFLFSACGQPESSTPRPAGEGCQIGDAYCGGSTGLGGGVGGGSTTGGGTTTGNGDGGSTGGSNSIPRSDAGTFRLPSQSFLGFPNDSTHNQRALCTNSAVASQIYWTISPSFPSVHFLVNGVQSNSSTSCSNQIVARIGNLKPIF